MPCPENIPEYLHWNNRQPYSPEAFLDEHFLYRLGNPVAFPSMLTDYSCKWSFLIALEDVLSSQDPFNKIIYADFRYAKVEDVRAFKLVEHKDADNSYLGWHVLTCTIEHAPEECDYSHSVINITHEIFEDEARINRTAIYKYTRNNWKDSLLKKGSSHWFKKFKANYQTEIIKLFYLPLEDEYSEN